MVNTVRFEGVNRRPSGISAHNGIGMPSLAELVDQDGSPRALQRSVKDLHD
jgi:hypothetical protein